MFIKSPAKTLLVRVVACLVLLAVVLPLVAKIPVPVGNIEEHMEAVLFLAIVAMSVLLMLALRRLFSDARTAQSKESVLNIDL